MHKPGNRLYEYFTIQKHVAYLRAFNPSSCKTHTPIFKRPIIKNCNSAHTSQSLKVKLNARFIAQVIQMSNLQSPYEQSKCQISCASRSIRKGAKQSQVVATCSGRDCASWIATSDSGGRAFGTLQLAVGGAMVLCQYTQHDDRAHCMLSKSGFKRGKT